MKAFLCDEIRLCGKCYLDILQSSKYQHLIQLNTKIIDVSNEYRCEDCKELCSSQDSLNSFKHIITIFEKIK